MKNKSLDLMFRMDLIKSNMETLLDKRSNDLLLEFALPRKKVKGRISNMLPQIIENWCLIKYSNINNINNNLVNHWKNELSAHLNNVSRLQIKENDSFDNRKTLLNSIIIEEDLTDVNVIDMIICSKFVKENISIDSKEYGNVIIDFINNINIIVDLICNKNRDLILNYIKEL